MAEIAQVGDADVVDAKNENRIFAALHAVAFVVKRRNDVNRHVADRSRDFLPIFAGRGETVQDHRRARGHVNAVMRSVLMAGGDDMLRQSRARQIERAMRIG